MSAQELRLQQEKVRVYALARELNIESKDLLDLCRQAGIDVKNQLSSLDPEQRDAIEQLVKRGAEARPSPRLRRPKRHGRSISDVMSQPGAEPDRPARVRRRASTEPSSRQRTLPHRR